MTDSPIIGNTGNALDRVWAILTSEALQRLQQH